jgi:biotin carboxyl carrier protein
MTIAQNSADTPASPPQAAMAKKWLVAILVLTFAFVLMPFLLWYMTTFSRPLNDVELGTYFTDAAHPRRAQHALSQVADRIRSPSAAIRESAKPWYAAVVKSAAQGSDELRVTAAWVMGQDNQSTEFHAALLKQLTDANPMVRRNAALSLVRFADPAGHDVIRGMLTPYSMAAPRPGRLTTRLKQQDVINPGTLVAHIAVTGESVEVRSEVPGTIRQWTVPDGASVQAEQPILVIDPSPEMVWESLRALYLIGQQADIAEVDRYARGLSGMPPQIQQQATLTAKAISTRETR